MWGAESLGFQALAVAGKRVTLSVSTYRAEDCVARFLATGGTMPRVIARLMHADGKYHFGASTTPAHHLGPLFGIMVEGEGNPPPLPSNPATPAEYSQWKDELRNLGFTVSELPIDES